MRELPAHASRLQASSVLVPIVPEKRAPRYRNQDRLTACRGRVCIGFAGEPLRLPGLLIVGIEIPGPMPVAAQTPSYPGSIPMIVSHGLLRAVASHPQRRLPEETYGNAEKQNDQSRLVIHVGPYGRFRLT
jgi:hypothetical protein